MDINSILFATTIVPFLKEKKDSKIQDIVEKALEVLEDEEDSSEPIDPKVIEIINATEPKVISLSKAFGDCFDSHDWYDDDVDFSSLDDESRLEVAQFLATNNTRVLFEHWDQLNLTPEERSQIANIFLEKSDLSTIEKKFDKLQIPQEQHFDLAKEFLKLDTYLDGLASKLLLTEDEFSDLIKISFQEDCVRKIVQFTQCEIPQTIQKDIVQHLLDKGDVLTLADSLNKLDVSHEDQERIVKGVLERYQFFMFFGVMSNFTLPKEKMFKLIEQKLMDSGPSFLKYLGNHPSLKGYSFEIAKLFILNGYAKEVMEQMTSYRYRDSQLVVPEDKLGELVIPFLQSDQVTLSDLTYSLEFVPAEENLSEIIEYVLNRGSVLDLQTCVLKFDIPENFYERIIDKLIQGKSYQFIIQNLKRDPFVKHNKSILNSIIMHYGVEVFFKVMENFSISKEERTDLIKTIIRIDFDVFIANLNKLDIPEECLIEVIQICLEIGKGRGVIKNFNSFGVKNNQYLSCVELLTKNGLGHRLLVSSRMQREMSKEDKKTVEELFLLSEKTPLEHKSKYFSVNHIPYPKEFMTLSDSIDSIENKEVQDLMRDTFYEFFLCTKELKLSAQDTIFAKPLLEAVLKMPSPTLKRWINLQLVRYLRTNQILEYKNSMFQLAEMVCENLGLPKLPVKERAFRDIPKMIDFFDFLKVFEESSYPQKHALYQLVHQGDTKEYFSKLKVVKSMLQLKATDALDKLLKVNPLTEVEIHKEYNQLIKSSLNLEDIENFEETWKQNVVKKFRDPSIALTYMATLHSRINDNILLARKALSNFMQWVLTGEVEKQRFSEQMAPTYHLIKEKNPEFAEIWKETPSYTVDSLNGSKQDLDLKKALKEISSENYPFMPKSFENPEQRIQEIDNIDRENRATKVKTPKELIIEKNLLSLLRITDKKEQIQLLSKISKWTSKLNNGSSFAKVVDGWKEELQKKKSFVEITVDPYDLLAQGTELQRSCQKVTKSPHLCCGLAKRLISGDIRLLVVKDPQGKMIGRTVLRLMVNENKEPVVFVEQFYVNDNNAEVREAMNKAVEKEAKRWNIPVYAKAPEKEGDKITTLSNGYPEYIDGLKGIQTNTCSLTEVERLY